MPSDVRITTPRRFKGSGPKKEAKIPGVEVTDSSVTLASFASFFGPDPLNLLFVVLLTSLGTWGLPQMVQTEEPGKAVVKGGGVGNQKDENNGGSSDFQGAAAENGHSHQ